jgi:molybdopterin/thiamine biosynthesis adenylyltransferase
MRNSTSHLDALHGARALVIGVGGLGSPAAAALAAAGVGTLGLVDPDRVELSNLHRQPLYDEADLGRPKVEAAAARLVADHPALHVETWRTRFDADAAALLDGFDVVLDGTDSVAAKFAVNDAAVARGVALIHAGAIGARAQLLTVLPGQSACYRCLFEDPPPPDEVASCQEAGVLGPSVVLAGALQAADAIRVLTGVAPLFTNRLLVLDTWAGRWRTVGVAPRRDCPACGALHQDLITQRSVGS